MAWADFSLLTSLMPKDRYQAIDRGALPFAQIGAFAQKEYSALQKAKAQDIISGALQAWDYDASKIPEDEAERTSMAENDSELANYLKYFAGDYGKSDAAKYRRTAQMIGEYDPEKAAEMIKYADTRDLADQQAEERIKLATMDANAATQKALASAQAGLADDQFSAMGENVQRLSAVYSHLDEQAKAAAQIAQTTGEPQYVELASSYLSKADRAGDELKRARKAWYETGVKLKRIDPNVYPFEAGMQEEIPSEPISQATSEPIAGKQSTLEPNAGNLGTLAKGLVTRDSRGIPVIDYEKLANMQLNPKQRSLVEEAARKIADQRWDSEQKNQQKNQWALDTEAKKQDIVQKAMGSSNEKESVGLYLASAEAEKRIKPLTVAELRAITGTGIAPVDWFLNMSKLTSLSPSLNAAITFSNNALRNESGAVINASETADFIKQYFPMEGDSPESIRDKEAYRKAKLDGLRISAGNALTWYEKHKQKEKKPQQAPKIATDADLKGEL